MEDVKTLTILVSSTNVSRWSMEVALLEVLQGHHGPCMKQIKVIDAWMLHSQASGLVSPFRISFENSWKVKKGALKSYIPRTCLSSILGFQPSKRRPFPIETAVISVLGIYIYIEEFTETKHQMWNSLLKTKNDKTCPDKNKQNGKRNLRSCCNTQIGNPKPPSLGINRHILRWWAKGVQSSLLSI